MILIELALHKSIYNVYFIVGWIPDFLNIVSMSENFKFYFFWHFKTKFVADKENLTPNMAVAHVKKILEYKNHNNDDFFLVVWQDNSKTWVYAANLNCKELIIEFIQSAIKLIEDNVRIQAQIKREKAEKEILEKLMRKNEKDVIEIESKNLEHIKNILRNTKKQNNGKNQKKMDLTKENNKEYNNDRPGYFNGMRRAIDTENRHLNEKDIYSSQFNKISQNIFKNEFSKTTQNEFIELDSSISGSIYSEPISKKWEGRSMKSTSLIVKIIEDEFLTINFYYNENIPVINFDISLGTFVMLNDIACKLFLPYANGHGFAFYPSIDNNTQPSFFEEILKNQGLFYMQKIENTVWVLGAVNDSIDLFKIRICSRFVLFRFENDEILSFTSKLQNFSLANSAWVKDSFRIGNQLLSNFLFKDNYHQIGKTIFILADKRMSDDLFSYIKNFGEIVTNIEAADTVIISEPYLNFLHLIQKFYVSLRKATRFLLLQKHSFLEILPNGGIITFSSDFLKNVEVLLISDFLDLIAKKNNWMIKISNDNFQTFERRLNEQKTDPAFLHIVKKVYQILSRSIYLDSLDTNLRDHLESTFYKTHRFFLNICNIKLSDSSISLEEACQIVSNN